jgi:hypothetical protein
VQPRAAAPGQDDSFACSHINDPSTAGCVEKI